MPPTPRTSIPWTRIFYDHRDAGHDAAVHAHAALAAGGALPVAGGERVRRGLDRSRDVALPPRAARVRTAEPPGLLGVARSRSAQADLRGNGLDPPTAASVAAGDPAGAQRTHGNHRGRPLRCRQVRRRAGAARRQGERGARTHPAALYRDRQEPHPRGAARVRALARAARPPAAGRPARRPRRPAARRPALPPALGRSAATNPSRSICTLQGPGQPG